jgi:nicotinate phosphoribosyltransferase
MLGGVQTKGVLSRSCPVIRMSRAVGLVDRGGVYKLVAVQVAGAWRPAIKVADTPEKTPLPGPKQAWRVYDRRGKAAVDLIGLEDDGPYMSEQLRLHHPIEPAQYRTM